ncbi:MAG TPA: neutral/alkaline non-lysosomal ceramidase N-terminal domain-containing protein, partial [Phycisphaerae bacterium]|nr:neutral/alkaline non-lysosomal ceramidase N-terminal domain-containing protein [Phycisphaerae bacterium]
MTAERNDSTVLVGAGCAVINPQPGIPLLGYPRPRPNKGVGLDLCARAIVFAEPGASAPQAAIVVLDNLGADLTLVRQMRQRAAEAVPGLRAETVMVAATHTHSAPTLRRYHKPDREPVLPDPQYIEQVIAGAAHAIAQAWKAAKPATMRTGRTEAFLGHNRRVLDPEGKASADWLDPEGRHTGYYDPQLPFAAFDDAETGKVHTMVVSYWCHPVTLGPDNYMASADYPGYFVRRLEAATGAATVLHVTGGGGNINPRQALFASPEHTEKMGHELAAKVLAAMDSTTP